jgi:hypothetical protein
MILKALNKIFCRHCLVSFPLIEKLFISLSIKT